MSILVTGKSGSLAKDIHSFFGDYYQKEKILYSGREELNLTNKSDVNNFFQSHKIEYVLHTAIKGGRRTQEENYEVLYNNLLMFHNLSSHISKMKLFINFDSMASFDRRYAMNNIKEDSLFHRLPKDFYGLSKNIICRLGLIDHKCFLNLRIFSCFSENEASDRMIKGNILRYLKNDPMIVHQNKYMDFVYSYDVLKVVKYCIENVNNLKKRSYNICYKNKTTLLEVAEMINNLSNRKVGIILQNKEMGLPVTGCGKSIEKLNIQFTGLEEGIKRTYDLIRNSK